METIWSQYSLQIMITLGLLAVVFIYTWLRDLIDSPSEKGKPESTSSNNSADEDSFWNEIQEVHEPIMVSKASKKSFKGLWFGMGNAENTATKIISSKQIKISLTGNMIDALRNLDAANFITRILIKKFVPENLLNELISKAMNNELESGMTLEIADGQIHLTRNPKS